MAETLKLVNNMLKFKEYIAEENKDVMLDVDSNMVTSNFDAINNDLDAVTTKPFQNAPIFLNAVRGTLERYGIALPASATQYFINLDAELVYMLGESPYHLYIVYNTNDDGWTDGYAQLLTADELSAVMNMSPEELVDRTQAEMQQRYLPARRDDDSGNTSEYA